MNSESKQDPPEYLAVVMYFLHNIFDVNDKKYYERLEKELAKPKYEDRLKGFKKAVEWALDNPGFDFNSCLSVPHNNDQVFVFFKEINPVLSRLTD